MYLEEDTRNSIIGIIVIISFIIAVVWLICGIIDLFGMSAPPSTWSDFFICVVYFCTPILYISYIVEGINFDIHNDVKRKS